MGRREAALALALVCTIACTTEEKESGKASSEDGPSAPDGERGTPTEDPAPEIDEPGSHTCKGCPTGDVDEFEVDAGEVTSEEFSGHVEGADGNGTFHIEGADGQTITGTIPTKPNGDYTFEALLFCGEQTVKSVWSNEEGRYVLVQKVTTTGCSEPALRVTLSWDGNGEDFELHLLRAGGRINDGINDCTWKSCIGDGLDWGVAKNTQDNPKKDVDNTKVYGPENIFLQAPPPGKYTVMVEHWGGGRPTASGNVTVNVRGKEKVIIPIDGLASKNVFTAATIEFPSGIVTPIATELDCSGTWNDGCKAPISAL